MFRFSTPARQNDFPHDPGAFEALCTQWNTNLTGFTLQAITGDPWNSTNAADQTWYYNPATTGIPQGTRAVLVSWTAFPHRLTQYLADPQHYNLSNEELFQLADTGSLADGRSFDQLTIPTVLCPEPNWGGSRQPNGPYGPRGWQDEYCEWSVVRDPVSKKITRVDITCENPEYWNSLWMIDPEQVASLYQDTLNWELSKGKQIDVKVADLMLYDPHTGAPVIDPSTGRPAYNPLNRWNSGPMGTRNGSQGDSGGAMHLTSTPNTLQTEMGLAAAATVARSDGNWFEQRLICCSQYGQPYRNSDPHIGLIVNQTVNGVGNKPSPPTTPAKIALADPTGLYIQMPDFTQYSLPKDPRLPAGATPADCWHVIRGAETLNDPVTGQDFPGNFILHAVFQIPRSWIEAGVGFTVGDITINGSPIDWGGQIVQTLSIGLFARPISVSEEQTPLPCVGVPDVSLAQPLQLMHADVWDAYYNTAVTNPAKAPMNLASNSTLIAPVVGRGARNALMVLTCDTLMLGPRGELPQVGFPSASGATDIVVRVLGSGTANYAVPGNSYPSQYTALTLSIDVDPNAQTGLRGVQVTNYGQRPGQTAPAFLNVVPAGTVKVRP